MTIKSEVVQTFPWCGNPDRPAAIPCRQTGECGSCHPEDRSSRKRQPWPHRSSLRWQLSAWCWRIGPGPGWRPQHCHRPRRFPSRLAVWPPRASSSAMSRMVPLSPLPPGWRSSCLASSPASRRAPATRCCSSTPRIPTWCVPAARSRQGSASKACFRSRSSCSVPGRAKRWPGRNLDKPPKPPRAAPHDESDLAVFTTKPTGMRRRWIWAACAACAWFGTHPPAALAAEPNTSPAAASGSTPAPAPNPNETVTLNFVDADIEGVVKAMAQITGKNFVIDPRVKGVVNIISAQPVARADVYDVFLSALRLQGFAAVEDRGLVKILPEADAKLHRNLAAGQRAGSDGIQTRVFTLTHQSAVQLVPTLRPLVAPNNTITALQNSNTLIVTDYASNLERLAGIIAAVDQPDDSGSAMVVLRHASALDAARSINRLFAAPPRAVQTLQGGDPSEHLVVIADARSNSLLVRAADPAQLAQIRQFAAMLDSPTSAAGNVHVVYLKNAEAVQLAATLRGIHAGSAAAAPTFASGPPTETAASGSPLNTGGGTATTLDARGPSMADDSGAQSAGAAAPGIIQADAATNSIIITAPDTL